MNSHNPGPKKVVTVEDVRIEADHDDLLEEESGPVRVLDTDVIDVKGLTIEEDPDEGGDPYNRTGQHVIIKSKIDWRD